MRISYKTTNSQVFFFFFFLNLESFFLYFYYFKLKSKSVIMFLKYFYLIDHNVERQAGDFHMPSKFVLEVFACSHFEFPFVLLAYWFFHKNI